MQAEKVQIKNEIGVYQLHSHVLVKAKFLRGCAHADAEPELTYFVAPTLGKALTQTKTKATQKHTIDVKMVELIKILVGGSMWMAVDKVEDLRKTFEDVHEVRAGALFRTFARFLY